MTPLAVIAAVVGMVWSTRARVTGTVIGLPFSVPLLGIAAAVLALIIVGAVLVIVRGIVRDWPRTVPA